ncbi:MAG: SCO family protein [Paracoccaceae bacterium]|tara:strand:+ start:4536 stop:5123 length:588 start_codon:yes stop_codon:yes gene_type:complete
MTLPKKILSLSIIATFILGCSSKSPEYSTVLTKPIKLDEFMLTADDDSVFSNQSLKDKWSLLFFGYTHCPDVCPLTLHQLAQANKELADKLDSTPDIIMVSVDPDRDTSEILQKYVRSFGENVSGVTGKNEELDKLTSQLGIFYNANKHEGENYSVNHSAAVILINKNAEFHAVFSAPHSIEHFVSDLPLILKES